MLGMTKFGTISQGIKLPPLLVDYLVVAGGGGAGGSAGDGWCAGGGGAGGFLTSTGLELIKSTNYTINIGAGGTHGTSVSSNKGHGTTAGSNGADSVFGNIIAKGGGGGGGANGYLGTTSDRVLGLDGGSGGGGGVNYNSATPVGGDGTANQGYAGGDGAVDGSGHGGGGGGAGGAGLDNAVYSSGGGSGVSSSISGASVTYASGGDMGVSSPPNAVANRGDGGDSAWAPASTIVNGGNGGSGIVILRFPRAYTLTVSAGLTYTINTVGEDRVYQFTAGTGTVKFKVISGGVPDGATVEPVDGYAVWLKCAGIPNTFGSLANVIADAGARLELTNDLNALRYMVRSSTIMTAVLADSGWVTALDNCDYAVTNPTMTSNTAPSGVVSASSYHQTYYPYQAYNKSTANAWLSVQIPVFANTYIQYAFSSEKYVYKAKAMHNNGSSDSSTRIFKIQGLDGASYVDVTGELSSGLFTSVSEYQTYVFNTIAKTTTVRMQFISGTGISYYAGFADIVLYGLDLS